MTRNDTKYRNERTSIGNMMYDMLWNATKIVEKHKSLYWGLNLTWGILTTLCGLLMSLVLVMCRKKPYTWRGIWYFTLCKDWGGLEMGTMFLRDTASNESINNHEYGHTLQNAILGPFFIFLVAIPSAIRYWYMTIRAKHGKKNNDYDAIWFEGSATDIGNRGIKDEISE